MSKRIVKIGSFLKRRKDSIIIKDNIEYKRITIKTKHQGIFLRDIQKGVLIGTKLQFTVNSGQFLLSKIDARYGAFGIVPKEVDGGIITGNFWTYDVDDSIVNIAWFNLFTSSSSFYNICDQASSGTTHRKYLDEKKFLNFEVNLPTREDQELFILNYNKYYKTLCSLTKELNQQQSYLQLLRQTILQEAVQGKLTQREATDEPASELLKRIKAEKQQLIKEGKLKKEKELPPIAEDEIPFELPEGWAGCRLQEVAYVGNGSTPDKKEFTDLTTDIPYLKVYNIVDQKVNFHYKPQYIKKLCHQGQLKRSICYSGDVLMNIVGPPLGKIAIVPDDLPECNINQAIVVIRPFLGNLNRWIYWYLCEQSAVKSIVTKGTAGQDNISVTQSRNLVFPLPPLAEQQHIVTKVEQMQQQLSQLEAQVQQSKSQAEMLLQAVLKEAFEGKKVYAVNEVESVVAEE